MFVAEIVLLVVLVAADILTKNLSASLLTALPDNRFPIIDGVISFKYLQNTGAAFGIFGEHTVYLAVFSAIACVALGVFLVFNKKNGNRLMRAALIMILAGGLGNLFDRIFLGYVRDFIYFELINFAIFNVADAVLCIGVALLLVYIIFVYKEPQKPVPVKDETRDAAEDNDVGKS